MKKYLQACELGGSIYGKKRDLRDKGENGDRQAAGENTIASYKKFFKNQLANMDRVFRREG